MRAQNDFPPRGPTGTSHNARHHVVPSTPDPPGSRPRAASPPADGSSNSGLGDSKLAVGTGISGKYQAKLHGCDLYPRSIVHRRRKTFPPAQMGTPIKFQPDEEESRFRVVQMSQPRGGRGK